MDIILLQNLKQKTNEELLELNECSGMNYVSTSIEFSVRRLNGQITDEEFQKFKDIAEKINVYAIDSILPKTDKSETKNLITESMNQMIDKAFDKNR